MGGEERMGAAWEPALNASGRPQEAPSQTNYCPRCQAAYGLGRPEYFGDDPKCAFPGGGKFTPDNWQCKTADIIRDLVGEFPCAVERPEVVVTTCGDQKVATITFPDGADLDHYDQFIPALVMTWYKRRGRTDTILLITDEGTAIAPTANDIEMICDALGAPAQGQNKP